MLDEFKTAAVVNIFWELLEFNPDKINDNPT